MTQGTVNGGDRGNVEDRRRRREWLVETFRADCDLAEVRYPDGTPAETTRPRGTVPSGAIVAVHPACRCYRCGKLLTVDTVSPDRIVPGCKGGTYKRSNIRPACLRCQSITGNEIKRAVRGQQWRSPTSPRS